MKKSNRKIILASGSPRRKDILMQASYEFEIIKSDCPEIITKTNPLEIVCELSKQKACDVLNKIKEKGDFCNSLLIGADTIVAFDDRILGKPKNREDAICMLKSLSGRTHQVHTGVTCIYDLNGEIIIKTFSATTDVVFADVSDEEIVAYVDSGEPMDKAGAYAIQGGYAKYITSINGEYNNVVGFPIAAFYKEMKEVLEDYATS